MPDVSWHEVQFPAEPQLACIEAWDVFKEDYHQTIIGGSVYTHQEATHLPARVSYIDNRRDTVLISPQTLYAMYDFGFWLDLSKLENFALALHNCSGQCH